MKRTCIGTFILSIVLLVPFLSRAEQAVRIDSVGRIDSRIPIAVPPFYEGPNANPYGRVLSETMASDLEFTGLFRLVPADQ